MNAAVTALRFFFDVTLGRGELMAKMSHVHQPRKLPTVLGCEGTVLQYFADHAAQFY